MVLLLVREQTFYTVAMGRYCESGLILMLSAREIPIKQLAHLTDCKW